MSDKLDKTTLQPISAAEVNAPTVSGPKLDFNDPSIPKYYSTRDFNKEEQFLKMYGSNASKRDRRKFEKYWESDERWKDLDAFEQAEHLKWLQAFDARQQAIKTYVDGWAALSKTASIANETARQLRILDLKSKGYFFNPITGLYTDTPNEFDKPAIELSTELDTDDKVVAETSARAEAGAEGGATPPKIVGNLEGNQDWHNYMSSKYQKVRMPDGTSAYKDSKTGMYFYNDGLSYNPSTKTKAPYKWNIAAPVAVSVAQANHSDAFVNPLYKGPYALDMNYTLTTLPFIKAQNPVTPVTATPSTKETTPSTTVKPTPVKKSNTVSTPWDKVSNPDYWRLSSGGNYTHYPDKTITMEDGKSYYYRVFKNHDWTYVIDPETGYVRPINEGWDGRPKKSFLPGSEWQDPQTLLLGNEKNFLTDAKGWHTFAGTGDTGENGSMFINGKRYLTMSYKPVKYSSRTGEYAIDPKTKKVRKIKDNKFVGDWEDPKSFKYGGTMNKINYFQLGGTAPQQDMQQLVVALVQAAMQGDQKATQQVTLIMEAAKAGDQQAVQIAQMIQQVVQQMQGLATAAKWGAKLSYIKSLKYAKGGKACPACMSEGGDINKPAKNNTPDTASKKPSMQKPLKKAEPVKSAACGGKTKKRYFGGWL